MAKKTFNEKLNNSGGLPKIEFVDYSSKMASRFGVGKMVIAPPIDYDNVMKNIPQGKVITSNEIREIIANKYNADFTCQLTAGIFINIVANASRERENNGEKDVTPYWRTLKKNGELNEKYPDGTEGQKLLLELEGHEIVKKGKKYFVKEYEEKIYKPKI